MESFFSDEDRVQLAFLRDEEVDELVLKSFCPEEARLTSALEAPIEFPFAHLILHITPGDYYPVLSEFSDFFRVENLQLGIVPCDLLRGELHDIYDEASQANALSMWESREELSPYGLFERTMLVFKLVSHTREFLGKHQVREMERLHLYHRRAPPPERRKDKIQQKRIAQEVKSSSEVARELLGPPGKIVENIPSWMRVLHVEEILRGDLAKKFKKKRAEMRDEISRLSATSVSRFLPPGVKAHRRADAIDRVLEPRLTFHGTKRSNVPSIVRHGFLKPETVLPGRQRRKDEPHTHQVQQGCTYGRGIYSSPSAEYCLSYSGERCGPTQANEYFGLKVVVCATLMGRWTRVDRASSLYEDTAAMENFDSHMAVNDLEFVVFEEAQILPVYVIHLDWAGKNEKHYTPPPSNAFLWKPSWGGGPGTAMAGAPGMTPGDLKRAKDAIMARASKWFPYGFGPKSKGNFVVEDVAEVSEDEEEYGDLQTFREDKESGGGNSDYWSWVKADEAEGEDDHEKSLDEYKASKRGQYAPKSLDWDSVMLPGDKVPIEESEDGDLGIGLLLSLGGSDVG